MKLVKNAALKKYYLDFCSFSYSVILSSLIDLEKNGISEEKENVGKRKSVKK